MDDLLNLLACHSTPGDEDEVRGYLLRKWKTNGLSVEVHGQYAVSARFRSPSAENPTVLVCAHMDSPGYAVEQIDQDKIKLIKLGSPYFEGEHVAAVLKTRSGKIPISIEKHIDDRSNKRYYSSIDDSDVRHGDRACFAGTAKLDRHGSIRSPFLDNRLGCHILCALSEIFDLKKASSIDLVLGATACEEVGCLGAPVLAHAIKPDLVFCLDATYENLLQNVVRGKGPVLTLSDASVILSCDMRDRITNLFDDYDIPLQTEVYNYSGTDSKAFPLSGLSCPVIALLVATSGNHSPRESASVKDIESLTEALRLLVTGGGVEELLR